MGLLLSVLVGCVGVYELLACLGRASDRASILRIESPSTCLSYHDCPQGGFTGHDSLCGIGHSSDLRLSRGAKYKLENLHEYSLKIRSELRSLGSSYDTGTLSECSTRDFLGELDSRLDVDLECLECAETTASSLLVKDKLAEGYTRVSTPIPSSYYTKEDQQGGEDSSNESEISFDEDSRERATSVTKSLDASVVVEKYKDSPSSGDESDDDDDDDNDSVIRRPVSRPKSKSPELSKKANYISESPEAEKGEQHLSTKRSRTTIVRKATRLKSKNAEISKSAENLSAKRSSKRHREPERRKSEISVRTARDLFRDEWTNTSPPTSPSLSRSESKKSVDAEVQTYFEEKSLEPEEEFPVFGLSESKRDLASRDRRAKKWLERRRISGGFRSASSETSTEDRVDSFIGHVTAPVAAAAAATTTATATAIACVEKSREPDSDSLKISTFQRAERDDYERIRDVVLESDSKGRSGGGWRKEKEKEVESLRAVVSPKSTSSFEDDTEEYVSAEDVSSTHEKGPTLYTTPDTDRNKAFWVIWKCVDDTPLFRCPVIPFDENSYLLARELVFSSFLDKRNSRNG
ncbi:hypothetical protein KPH14_004983 [Odynerus spinipes]|uniref:Uncharacterized protein n=1 Tax=Odynerus spinipes TaxID=1348599 RepID=A0AAD9RP15_9HYME|nr:hypothetical protein KPH14_004983 [Odynerus spinipes]